MDYFLEAKVNATKNRSLFSLKRAFRRDSNKLGVKVFFFFSHRLMACETMGICERKKLILVKDVACTAYVFISGE